MEIARDGEHQADQHRARVAHEDPGRVHVVRQEAQAHAHEDGGEQGGGGGRLDSVSVPEPVGVHEERRRRRCTPCRPARPSRPSTKFTALMVITTSATVSRVPCQRGQRDRADAGDGQPQDGQALHDHHARGDHLAAELDQGVDLELVVQDADQPDQRGAGQQRPRCRWTGEDGAEVRRGGRPPGGPRRGRRTWRCRRASASAPGARRARGSPASRPTTMANFRTGPVSR